MSGNSLTIHRDHSGSSQDELCSSFLSQDGNEKKASNNNLRKTISTRSGSFHNRSHGSTFGKTITKSGFSEHQLKDSNEIKKLPRSIKEEASNV